MSYEIYLHRMSSCLSIWTSCHHAFRIIHPCVLSLQCIHHASMHTYSMKVKLKFLPLGLFLEGHVDHIHAISHIFSCFHTTTHYIFINHLCHIEVIFLGQMNLPSTSYINKHVLLSNVSITPPFASYSHQHIFMNDHKFSCFLLHPRLQELLFIMLFVYSCLLHILVSFILFL